MDERRWERIEKQIAEIKVALVGTPDGRIKGLRPLMDDLIEAIPLLRDRLAKLEVSEAKRKGWIAGAGAVTSFFMVGVVELVKWAFGPHKP